MRAKHNGRTSTLPHEEACSYGLIIFCQTRARFRKEPWAGGRMTLRRPALIPQDVARRIRIKAFAVESRGHALPDSPMVHGQFSEEDFWNEDFWQKAGTLELALAAGKSRILNYFTSGRVKEKIAPRPGSLRAAILPPWSSTIFLQMESPRPVPCALPCVVKG